MFQDLAFENDSLTLFQPVFLRAKGYSHRHRPANQGKAWLRPTMRAMV